MELAVTLAFCLMAWGYTALAKPPVKALTAVRLAQDAAPRMINFANDGLTTSFVPAPSVGSNVGSGDNSQWMKVEFHYSINPDPKKPFIDAVEFKVWIEGRDLYTANAQGGQGVAVCLTGSVTYVNLSKGRDGYGVFYVHPSTVARYSSANGIEDFDRKFNVHIDALVGGKLVDYFDKRKDPSGNDWYKAPPAVPNMVCRQDQSPFMLTDSMRYPQIKLENPPSQ